jgi:hypothetical protein
VEGEEKIAEEEESDWRSGVDILGAFGVCLERFGVNEGMECPLDLMTMNK